MERGLDLDLALPEERAVLAHHLGPGLVGIGTVIGARAWFEEEEMAPAGCRKSLEIAPPDAAVSIVKLKPTPPAGPCLNPFHAGKPI